MAAISVLTDAELDFVTGGGKKGPPPSKTNVYGGSNFSLINVTVGLGGNAAGQVSQTNNGNGTIFG